MVKAQFLLSQIKAAEIKVKDSGHCFPDVVSMRKKIESPAITLSIGCTVVL